MNDIENVPLGLIIAWADVIAVGNPTVHVIAISIFTFCRILFTIMYA
jgi:hypothetical protein